MFRFSSYRDEKENIGELVLEILLNSSIDTMINLDLSSNDSWFTGEERSVNEDLLVELLSKFVALQ